MADLREQLQSGLADRYRLERELGRGGMATVYLAQDLRHDRKVALKVLRPELAPTLGPERFQREIETCPSAAPAYPYRARLGRDRRATLVHDAVRRRGESSRPPEVTLLFLRALKGVVLFAHGKW